ncbi:sperm-specific sodium:proton exchanger-like [Ornithodoros turicata]|uniref:sperm-specific sodium:proton exchanger-like n=1 Tax=Ornithodoros turicata TaxID=34597 RepID=UPI003138CF6F
MDADGDDIDLEDHFEYLDIADVTDSRNTEGTQSTKYLLITGVLIVAVFLKKIQRKICFSYTIFMFAAGIAFSYKDIGNKNQDTATGWARQMKFNVLMFFFPAAAVYATQGINHFIFRRCYREILVFSVGTLGISTVVCSLYAYNFINTGSVRSSLLFAILLCSNERLPISDQLFQEGRYPILATMLQSESVLNCLFLWSMLDQMERDLDGILAIIYHVIMYHVVGTCGGIVMGFLAICSLRVAPQSQSSCTFLLICLTYITFCGLEVGGSSGIDGVVAFTLVINSHHLVACTELEELLHHYWSAIYDISGFMALYLSSVYTGELLFIFLKREELRNAVLTYFVRALARLLSVVALFPIIEQFGYPVSWKQAVVTVWMGLKGTLNITVVSYLYHRQASIDVDYVAKTFFHVVCDISLCQLVNVTLLELVFRVFGILEVSEIEENTMASAVAYLRDHVLIAGRYQHRDTYFLPVDWKWVMRKTMVTNPFSSSGHVWERLLRLVGYNKSRRKVDEKMDQLRAEQFAVENVLRIEQVSYSRQYREGMIQKNTMMTLLAALQYPFDKKMYLNAETIESLIEIPDWIKWLKESLSVSHFGEDLMDTDTESQQSQVERHLQERIIDLFEHQYYELVVTSMTLTFMFSLTGVLFTGSTNEKLERSLVIQGLFVALFGAEITTMITAYGHRFVRLDNYNKLDLVLVATSLFLFIVQFGMFLVQAEEKLRMALAVAFLAFMSVRLVHAIKYLQLGQYWVLDLVHRYLDKVIYTAYEASLAIITGEEEVQQNVWKYVCAPELALETRNRATSNRLLVLRNLVEIQARFPGIAVAFKSRQAGQTILNDVSAHLQEMQRDGFFTVDQYRDLHERLKKHMMGIICAPNSMPASYKPIAVLRVIPWIGSDSVRQFLALQLRPVSFAADDIIVERGADSPVVIAYSGIIRIEGHVACRYDGALPNSASSLFFFSEDYFEDYLGAPVTIGALGLVTDEPTLTIVSAETPVNAYLIPRSQLLEAIKTFTKPPSFLYQIWYYIANIFGVLILQSQAKYQTWPVEKIKLRLSSFLLPDLSSAHDFLVSPDIEDILLIQGTLVDVNVGDCYVAPSYIPRSVKRFVFPGDFATRPRPVLIVIANKHYKLPVEFDWLRKIPSDEEKPPETETVRKVYREKIARRIVDICG